MDASRSSPSATAGSYGRAGRFFHPSRVPALSRPSPRIQRCASAWTGPALAAIHGPTSSRAAEVASTPPARGWPASPAPYTPAAWRGRVSVARSASFTAPIACPANRCASPPGTVMALGAPVRDGISWQGSRRIQAVMRTQASWQRRQFTGPSLNRLGSCNAACGRYRRRQQNGSLGKGAGHPSAELSLGSRGVMNRRTLYAICLVATRIGRTPMCRRGQSQNGRGDGTLICPSGIGFSRWSGSETRARARAHPIPQ